MKLPINWLKDYVELDVTPKALADALTLSGSKVDGLEEPYAILSNVVTGKILRIEKHPDADKLLVCQVDVGAEEPIQIVTAATNIREGDWVPVALHGSTLWGGLAIKRGKLRGIESNGMFCSEEELGLAEAGTCDGIMILRKDLPLGADVKKILGIDGGVLDIEVTSNRPDCLSILGLARETAATFGTTYRQPEFGCTTVDREGSGVSVVLDTPRVRRYMAREIVDVTIGESPDWLKQRLLEAGVRPISNMVDVTNFVMLELGQPLHAFDQREIASGIIRVAEAQGGEVFTTLDNAERTLPKGTLLIMDDQNIIGLAGIMGGLDSEIKEDTTHVILEVANFDGVTIRRTEDALNLRTEASTRFDKDLDPGLCTLALDRVCHLVESLGIGRVLTPVTDVVQEAWTPRSLSVSGNWINAFLGTDIPLEEMRSMLTRLDIQAALEGETLKLILPTFRRDLAIKEDIAEEVARLYGYNRIPATLPTVNAVRSGRYRHQLLRRKLTELLLASGLYESISYSFIGRKDLDRIRIPADSPLRDMVEIRNPLGEDFSVMRTSTVSSMMESLARNHHRSNEEAALFEVGKVYLKTSGALPLEKNILTVGLYGEKDLFFELKGMVELLLEEFRILGTQLVRSEKPHFHPGKSAEVRLKDAALAGFGEIHPDVLENYDMDRPAWLLELDLDLLFEHADTHRAYAPLPRYPAVTRDIAVVLEDDILVQELEKIFEKQGGALLESYRLFDVYKGKNIPEGKKSVAYNLVYRNRERTLTDKEVAKVHDKIVRTIEHLLGGILR